MTCVNNEYVCDVYTEITTYIGDIFSTTYITPITENIDLNFSNELDANLITDNIINSNIEDIKTISEIIFTSEETDKNNIEYSTLINLENSNENKEISYLNVTDDIERDSNDCIVNIKYISDNLTIYIISKYLYDYINESSNNKYNLKVNQYINTNFNFTITIFNTWYCTNLLLLYDYFDINSNLIFDKINNNLEKKKIMFLFILI